MVPPYIALVLLILVAFRPAREDGRTRVLDYLVPTMAVGCEQVIIGVDVRLQQLPLNGKVIILHDC